MDNGRAFMALINTLAGCFMLWFAFNFGKL
jgi:hypothetical protein